MMLGDQFEKKLRKAFNSRHRQIAETAGERIKEQMFANVDRGVDFTYKKFKGYAKSTKVDRANKKFQIKFVDFQRDLKRIKLAFVRYVGRSAEILWPPIKMSKEYNIGTIFYFHQYGMGKNEERNIFPKKESDIRAGVHNDIRKKIGAILDEPVK